jgi:glycosyltransferase involved in cell wall biosynthesis
VLVHPERTDEIRAGLLALSSDHALRQRLAASGLQVAQRNPWRVAAESTWRIYDELSADR